MRTNPRHGVGYVADHHEITSHCVGVLGGAGHGVAERHAQGEQQGPDGPRQSGKGPFRKAKLDLGIPPKTIPGEGFDFFKKTKGLEEPDHFGTDVQRHTPYAELYLLCPTHSCLRERRTLVSAKDPVETKFVTLADYECFNAKDGTVSQPYHPAKKDHGEAPAGLHRWSCHSKYDCKESRRTWMFDTAAEEFVTRS